MSQEVNLSSAVSPATTVKSFSFSENSSVGLAPTHESREPQEPHQTPSLEATESAIQALEASFQQSDMVRHSLHFSVAEHSGKTVIQITDQQTGDLIRQFPTEEAVAFAEHWAKTQQLLYPSEV